MKTTALAFAFVALQASSALAASAPAGSAVPEFGLPFTRRLTVISKTTDGLAMPRDLKFNPEKPGELWVVNRSSEGVVIYQAAGTDSQTAEARTDSFHAHFMAKVSSLAFGEYTNFASCQESNNGGNDFMGPTLWSSDLDIFANVNQNFSPDLVCEPYPRAKSRPFGYLGSHIDMLHQSPYCVGIAHATGNAFWTFDGANGNLVYYDFVQDHGPGNDDHSDGRLRRYTDVVLKRVAGVPGHMIVDETTGHLYIADTGTGRVLKVDPSTAREAGNLRATNEPLAAYKKFLGATVQVFAQGLQQPSGIAINDGRLFVSDHATGEIIAYSLETGMELDRVATGAEAIMGLAVSPEGQVWYVDAGSNTVTRVDAQ